MISPTSAFFQSHRDHKLLGQVSVIEKVGGDNVYMTFLSSFLVMSHTLQL